MKKVKQSYSKRYPVLRLYKDDLEEIVSIFKSHFTDIKIIADEYELSDIADVDNFKKPKITNFSIEYNHHNQDPSKSGLLSLDLKPDNAWLYLTDNTATYLFGVASQIDALLSKKKSVAGFVTSHIFIVSFFVYLLLLIVLIPLLFISHPFVLDVILFVLWPTIYINLSIWASNISHKSYCIIFLIHSNKKSSFLSRNKDQIIYSLTIGILSAILGGVLTAVIIFLLLHK